MQTKTVPAVRPALAQALERAAPLLRTETLALAAILTLAFAARVVWAAYTGWQPTPDDDAFRYDFLARALANGEGYVHLNGAPTAFWPPGYPLLLAAAYALFGQSVAVAQALNVVLGTATVALVYLLGRRLFGQATGLLAAAVVALWPSLVFYTGVTLSEVSFTFLALLGVYLLVVEGGRRDPEVASSRSLWLLIGAGVALGFATLTRGQALLLPFVVVPFWLLSGATRDGVARRLVAVLLGIGLIVAPWTVRNAVELDAPVLISTNAGVDFWIGHHDRATGDFGAAGGDPLVFRHPGLTTVEREVRVNAEGFVEGFEYAATHPLQELWLPFKKAFWLYYNDEEGLAWNEGHGGQAFLSSGMRGTLRVVSNVYYFTVLAMCLIGARFWLRRREAAPVLLISLVAYWTLVHLVFFGDPRFHAPIMPVVALLAALTWSQLWAGRSPWPRRRPD